MASLLIDRVPGCNPGRQKQKPRAFSCAVSRFFRPGFGGVTYTNPIPAPGWTVIRTSTRARTAATRPRSDAGTEAVVWNICEEGLRSVMQREKPARRRLVKRIRTNFWEYARDLTRNGTPASMDNAAPDNACNNRNSTT